MPLLEIVKEVFNLIKSKKIMTEVFPKLGGLPQPVIDKMLEKANDGMLLYTPVQKSVRGKRVCTTALGVARLKK